MADAEQVVVVWEAVADAEQVAVVWAVEGVAVSVAAEDEDEAAADGGQIFHAK